MQQDNGGDNKGANRRTSQLTLTFDHATFELKITGDIENYDTAMAMCDMAKRWAEQQIRNAQASQVLMPGAARFVNFGHKSS